MAAQGGEQKAWRWRQGDLDRGILPSGESLAVVREKVMAFWYEEVAPIGWRYLETTEPKAARVSVVCAAQIRNV